MSKPKINQRLEQSLSLSPQQLIRANILQLNSMMLEARLYQELESNPALEIDQLDSDIENPQTEDIEKEEEEEEESSIEDEENQDWEPKSEYSNIDFLSNLSNQVTITDQVLSALRDDNLSDEEIKISEQITGNLDDQGYLKIDPELISDKMKISKSIVMKVIEKIKHSEFPGLASSNIQECLIAQLDIYKISSLASSIINDYFDHFMNRRYNKIMESTHSSEDELQEALTIISQLNPNPRSMINETDFKKHTIIPDIIIDKINDKWNIVTNDGRCPNLLISENYLNMYQDKNQARDVKIFLKSKIESAKWFIEAIESRNKTIQKIMGSIIVRQKEYFESDQVTLKPMILKDIANDLNLDISTISRATKEKYVQMPWGIRELKFFFSKGIESDKGVVSSKNIKIRIQEIINSEDKLNPISDNDLTKILIKEGIKIARRTVTKYREDLDYSVSRLRKELR